MKIMVTGGAGFIGSHLSARLIKEGNEVVVVDDLSNGYKENVPEKAEFILADLADKNIYSNLPQDIDVIYHLASQASGEISHDDPLNDLNANSLATLALLHWSNRIGIKKFIFTSTMGMYNDNLSEPATEASPIEPKSFYGINKQASEGFIRIYKEEGMRTTIFRLFNVYGPGQNMSNLKQGMVSIYMSFILNKVPVCVKGPLKRTRDFVFIDDVIDALYLGLSEKSDGAIFNVCTGRELSVSQVLDKLFSAFNEPKDYPVNVQARTPRDIDTSCGNPSLINSILGWQAKISFEDGVKRMVTWLKVDK